VARERNTKCTGSCLSEGRKFALVGDEKLASGIVQWVKAASPSGLGQREIAGGYSAMGFGFAYS